MIGARGKNTPFLPQHSLQVIENGALFHLGIHLCGAHAAVPQQCLHRCDGHSLAQQLSGEGVPGGVKGDSFLDFHLFTKGTTSLFSCTSKPTSTTSIDRHRRHRFTDIDDVGLEAQEEGS